MSLLRKELVIKFNHGDMPELPEVETIKNYLKKEIIRKKIIDIEIISKKNFIGDKDKIINEKIVDIIRTGKYLSFVLSNKKYLNIHLKMTGELLFHQNKNQPVFPNIIPFAKTNKMPGRTTRVTIYFNDNSVLFFNDLRKFGWMKIADKPDEPSGVDLLSKKFTLNYFSNVIKKNSRPIKLTLLDQDKISGIGNIYANDALFLAKIHPLTKSNQLSSSQIAKLYQSIKKIIEQAIKNKGSSGADEAYILPDGTKGEHQRHFLVYQQEGKPCPVCQTKIKRIKQGGRSSFFCPRCQKIK